MPFVKSTGPVLGPQATNVSAVTRADTTTAVRRVRFEANRERLLSTPKVYTSSPGDSRLGGLEVAGHKERVKGEILCTKRRHPARVAVDDGRHMRRFVSGFAERHHRAKR